MSMTSKLRQTRIVWHLALCLTITTFWNESSHVLGQALPTKIESELLLTIEPVREDANSWLGGGEGGSLNLFLASTDEYILDVTFLCSYKWDLAVYDPFCEDVQHPAWRTAVFQRGLFVGYLKQPPSRRDFQRTPVTLKSRFVVGAATEIKTGPRTLLETTAGEPIVQVLGRGTYELQTVLLKNFLTEKPSEKSEVIARSAAFPLVVTEDRKESGVVTNPEGRAELHIDDFIAGRHKSDLYFYYVNTTSNTREIYNPFVQTEFGPKAVCAYYELEGHRADLLVPDWGRDFGVRPSLWVTVPTQGIVGKSPDRYLLSKKEVRIVIGEIFFSENFFRSMEHREATSRIYSASNLPVLESPTVVAP